MNLVGYTATALSRNDITDTPKDKNVVSGAIVELKTLQGDLVTIYDDAAGTNPETQKTCNSDGQCEFYVEAGDYNLEVNGKVNKISLFFNKDKVNDIAAWGERFVGYFADGFTYTKANDVAKGIDGKYHSYSGASAYPVVVSAGTVPSEPDYTPVAFNSADSIDYTPPSPNPAVRILKYKLGDFVSVNDFAGSNDSQKMQNAVNSGESILIPTNREYVIDEVMLPNFDVSVYGRRSKIRSNAGTHCFRQENSGHKTTLQGLDFFGDSISFDFRAQGQVPLSNSGHEHDISHCKFHESQGVQKIRLYGSREGIISSCEFKGNAGIEREFAINTQIVGCKWSSCDYMILDKLGSEGLIIVSPVALGGGFGVKCERSTGVQIVSPMIDYVDAPLDLSGCTDVDIAGGYISTRTPAPALRVSKYPDGFQGFNHTYRGVKFRTNDNNGAIVVSLRDVFKLSMSECHVLNQGDNSVGLEYGDVTNSTISIIQGARSGAVNAKSIKAIDGLDDATVKIRGGLVDSPIDREFNNEQDVSGWKTSGRGEAVITTGNSSIVVSHGLAITPSKLNITLTPTTPNTANLGYFVSATTATTFTITLTAAVTSTTAFAWKHSTI